MPENVEDLAERFASLAGQKQFSMPPTEVIENGQRVANPRIDPSVMSFVMQAAQLSQTVKIRKEIERHSRREEFEGKLDPRTLSATDETQCLELSEQWPYVPWISAFFINDGADEVYIRINRSEWIKIESGETRTLDHTHAEERIEQIYYKCDAGGTASIRVEGLY